MSIVASTAASVVSAPPPTPQDEEEDDDANKSSSRKDGATKDVKAVVHEDDGWMVLSGKTFMYKAELKDRFDARWSGDDKAWIIDLINIQHDEDGYTTPQAVCEWIQAQIDEHDAKHEKKREEANSKRKRDRDERDIQKKQKRELAKTVLPVEKKHCYGNAKLYESHNLDRSNVSAGFYAQCPGCEHYLYGMDKSDKDRRDAYYAKTIAQCWNCSAALSPAASSS